MWAHLDIVLASDWFSWLLTGSATADRWLLRGSRAQPEVRKKRLPGVKIDRGLRQLEVTWFRKPLTRGKIAGSGNRKSRDLGNR